ncbi:hypothetical protein MPNT_80096 [Candidatus Methylacidithermus pantelleriae]|uniref:Uncharacterized protein n=1 Tax=Candidatus Methylacidithermus pantelleriae TaxID=2744239 RepID=A0A8J2BPV1_9BACT|nr:hypothetical protein MPNT_80096 [Candidatus Methylacidithermus pantelleriae]
MIYPVCTLRGQGRRDCRVTETAGISEGTGAKCFSSIGAHAQGVLIHREVSWGNRVDWKTLVGLLVRLQRELGIQERTFVIDERRKKPLELRSARRTEGFRMSLELRETKLQERFSGSSQKIGSFGLPT